VYLKGKPEIPQKVYALIDDQSTHTLATPILFDRLEENAEQIRFVLSSCSGKTSMIGRKSSNYIIESLDHSVCIDVPSIIECSDIPNNREEIPSPEVVANHPHLKDLTSHILPIDLNTNIEILIGRDVISVKSFLSMTTKQILFVPHFPQVYQIKLVWRVCEYSDRLSMHILSVLFPVFPSDTHIRAEF
jgi:hypothetical protein